MDRLAAMEAFVQVVDAGSFSAAARRINIGQPAVSKSIAQLEERLGVKLLIRTTRGLAPTQAGLDFYEHARRAIEEADEADLAARGAGTGLAGKLRVCAAVTFARLHIVPHLPVFMERHPDIELELVLDDRNIDLVQESIDVGFRMGRLSDSGLTARRIATARTRVFGSAAYFEQRGTPQVPGDLAAHDTVVYVRQGSVWTFRKDGTELPVTVKGRLRMTAAEGLRAAVLAGAGIVTASEWMFAPELASGEIQTALDDWTLPDIDLWAVFPTGRMASTKARVFASFVEEIMSSPTGAHSPLE